MYHGGRRRAYAEINQAAGGDFALKSSYDQGLVDALKNDIPSTDRRWDPINKLWLFTEGYLDTVTGIVDSCLGVKVHIQTALPTGGVAGIALAEAKLIRVEYLGAAKDRGGDELVAYGYADSDWSVGIPLSVLKKWFHVTQKEAPGGSTYYAVLGIKKKASTKEIKAGYRRMARQWHPDVCKEPDANVVFQQVSHAYQILSDDKTRRKYDAALILLGSGYKSPPCTGVDNSGWRPPLRCGWLLVEGVMQLGRFNVLKILQWEDISNSEGRIMVSSWPAGAKRHEVVWV